MVRLNNGFDGLSSLKIIDAYIRNLHDYRIAIEISALSIFNFLLNQKENPIVIPTSEFEGIRSFITHLAHLYHKPSVNFICNNDTTHPLFRYQKELNLISQLISQSKKSYAYCLNDVIDFYMDNGMSVNDLIIPKNIIYVTSIEGKKFYKHLPKGFEETITEYKSLETNFEINNDTNIQDLYKNPQNLYLRLLGEFTEKGVDYLILQLYDFLIEETNNQNTPLAIKSNKLIQIWDDVKFVSQNQQCKPDIDKKINLLPLNKEKRGEGDGIFDYVMEEWAANLSRALELKLKIGIDFYNYLNTCNDSRFIENYTNGVYPCLTALVLFVERKIGISPISVSKRFRLV